MLKMTRGTNFSLHASMTIEESPWTKTLWKPLLLARIKNSLQAKPYNKRGSCTWGHSLQLQSKTCPELFLQITVVAPICFCLSKPASKLILIFWLVGGCHSSKISTLWCCGLFVVFAKEKSAWFFNATSMILLAEKE